MWCIVDRRPIGLAEYSLYRVCGPYKNKGVAELICLAMQQMPGEKLIEVVELTHVPYFLDWQSDEIVLGEPETIGPPKSP